MVIQFPHQARKRVPIQPQKTSRVGLYLLLAFALVYLVCVLWVQQQRTPSAATKAQAATSHATQSPLAK